MKTFKITLRVDAEDRWSESLLRWFFNGRRFRDHRAGEIETRVVESFQLEMPPQEKEQGTK